MSKSTKRRVADAQRKAGLDKAQDEITEIVREIVDFDRGPDGQPVVGPDGAPKLKVIETIRRKIPKDRAKS